VLLLDVVLMYAPFILHNFTIFVQPMHNICQQYLMLNELLHVSIFIHHPKGVYYYYYYYYYFR